METKNKTSKTEKSSGYKAGTKSASPKSAPASTNNPTSLQPTPIQLTAQKTPKTSSRKSQKTSPEQSLQPKSPPPRLSLIDELEESPKPKVKKIAPSLPPLSRLLPTQEANFPNQTESPASSNITDPLQQTETHPPLTQQDQNTPSAPSPTSHQFSQEPPPHLTSHSQQSSQALTQTLNPSNTQLETPTKQPPPSDSSNQPSLSETAAQSASDKPQPKIIHFKPPIIVKDLAAALGLKGYQVIHDLMELNVFASINQSIEPEIAAQVCQKHGFIFERERREKKPAAPPPPPPPKPEPRKPAELQLRPPVVTVMGHVDHGKTSLLDTIRKSRVAAGEAGGITQHIGAYTVNYNNQTITFIDTPGHAAFTAMRARGAKVTDIVVLVVAADDGVMPQTIEALNHAKAAGATIIVAINKIDLPSANPDKVMQQLMEHGLTPEQWGGETIMCPVSATKGTGVDHLLSMIALQAEILELKADPQAEPRATVIEAEVEPGRGPTATVIVRSGTLKPGQPFICGLYWGKIKQLLDDSGRPLKSAGPSIPAKVLGFTGLPQAGDELVVMESEREARELSEQRLEEVRLGKLTTPQRATLENLLATTSPNQKKVLHLVIKADVQGSLEAILSSLKEIHSEKVELDIIHSAVGPVSESDVLLACASNAVIIGFGIKVENNAASAAKREGVQIKLFSIIYELLDQVKEAMSGLLEPELRETIIGHAEIRKLFDLAKGRVAGCYVTDGRISRSARARILRGNQPIYDGGIATLRRFQDDVKEVRNGLECGVRLSGEFEDYEVGDIIECYLLEKIPQQL
ncbi:MAG: translation initiation factor IF-2 [Chthoniobacterales bacterium]|nr:translation initiation factor IF-2 [Chthoniobacterales bacterium]